MKRALLSALSIPLLLSSCKPEPIPAIAAGLDVDKMVTSTVESPDDSSQSPLPIEKADCAVIFVGGFLDCFFGSVRRSFNDLPPLQNRGKDYKEVRAYYHWEGNEGNIFSHNTDVATQAALKWIELNPKGTLVIIGHSYGGSASMDIARRIPKDFAGKLLVATLDPVSRRERSQPRQRAPRVDYWVNAYVTKRRAFHELFIMMAGTWNHCPQADQNLRFYGTTNSFIKQLNHAHRYAQVLLIARDPEQHI
ncbi:MAG: alpha/beta hydrolase, partial [Akkermansia sp.]